MNIWLLRYYSLRATLQYVLVMQYILVVYGIGYCLCCCAAILLLWYGGRRYNILRRFTQKKRKKIQYIDNISYIFSTLAHIRVACFSDEADIECYYLYTCMYCIFTFTYLFIFLYIYIFIILHKVI